MTEEGVRWAEWCIKSLVLRHFIFRHHRLAQRPRFAIMFPDHSQCIITVNSVFLGLDAKMPTITCKGSVSFALLRKTRPMLSGFISLIEIAQVGLRKNERKEKGKCLYVSTLHLAEPNHCVTNSSRLFIHITK